MSFRNSTTTIITTTSTDNTTSCKWTQVTTIRYLNDKVSTLSQTQFVCLLILARRSTNDSYDIWEWVQNKGFGSQQYLYIYIYIYIYIERERQTGGVIYLFIDLCFQLFPTHSSICVILEYEMCPNRFPKATVLTFLENNMSMFQKHMRIWFLGLECMYIFAYL